MSNKVQLRDEMKKKLADLPDHLYIQNCKKIHERLFSSSEWKKAKTIGITISVGKEIDTIEIIKEAWLQQKKIVVPKCFPDKKLLKFYQIESFSEVEESFYSLKEPIIAKTVEVEKKNIDLLIVPGLIFDQQGYRIGFGGGYYDRFLVDYRNDTVSLAFDIQMIEKIPFNEFDIPVNKIISHT